MAYTNDYLHNEYRSDDTSHNSKKTTRIHTSATKKSIKKPYYKLRKWVFGSIVVLVFFLLFFGTLAYDYSSVIFSSESSDIKQAGRDAGLNIHGQAIFLNNDPEFVDASVLVSVCPHDKETLEYGCYLTGSHKIYILQIDDTELKPIELTGVAHETLHAAWNYMSLDDKQTIGNELTTFYNSKVSDTLTNDAKPYQKEDTTGFVNELHSLAGSEVEIASMSSSLQSHFNEYFSEQDKTVGANIAFNQNINSQIADINAREKQLEVDNKQLDDFKVAHLDNIKASMQQNLYYGDTYTYNKNVDSFNHNREIYNDMIAKYNVNVDTYNTTRQNFVDAYSALFPDKTIPVAGAV